MTLLLFTWRSSAIVLRRMNLQTFLKSLGPLIIASLPEPLRELKVAKPWRWLLQLHYGEPRLHYEVSRLRDREAIELGLHFEHRDPRFNRFMLQGIRRHLFEIKSVLGEEVEAEMWDQGWTKIYLTIPLGNLDDDNLEKVSHKMAEFIRCMHPFYVDLRSTLTRSNR